MSFSLVQKETKYIKELEKVKKERNEYLAKTDKLYADLWVAEEKVKKASSTIHHIKNEWRDAENKLVDMITQRDYVMKRECNLLHKHMCGAEIKEIERLGVDKWEMFIELQECKSANKSFQRTLK